MFGGAIIMTLVLRYTAFGRYIYAIGGNQTASRLSGLAVTRIKIAAFMLCGFFAALAGIVHAAQLNQGSPNEAQGYELNAIAAVVIGGASLIGRQGHDYRRDRWRVYPRYSEQHAQSEQRREQYAAGRQRACW